MRRLKELYRMLQNRSKCSVGQVAAEKNDKFERGGLDHRVTRFGDEFRNDLTVEKVEEGNKRVYCLDTIGLGLRRDCQRCEKEDGSIFGSPVFLGIFFVESDHLRDVRGKN